MEEDDDDFYGPSDSNALQNPDATQTGYDEMDVKNEHSGEQDEEDDDDDDEDEDVRSRTFLNSGMQFG